MRRPVPFCGAFCYNELNYFHFTPHIFYPSEEIMSIEAIAAVYGWPLTIITIGAVAVFIIMFCLRLTGRKF